MDDIPQDLFLLHQLVLLEDLLLPQVVVMLLLVLLQLIQCSLQGSSRCLNTREGQSFKSQILKLI